MNFVVLQNNKIIPSKIVCVGRNYVDHIRELANEIPTEPVLFIKPNSAISQTIINPKEACRYEGELSFLIIGEKLAGIAFGLDLTLVEVQNRLKKAGLPWERAKAFNGSAIFSEFVVVNDWSKLRMELWINGELRQNGNITLMIYQPDRLLGEIMNFFKMEDGDIIMTGTPTGVGSFKSGDRFVGKIFEDDRMIIEQEWVVGS